MKFSKTFKRILFSTLVGLLLTGVVIWVLEFWFQIDHGMGPEPDPSRIWVLRAHAVIGLWFLMVFGAVFQSHILKGLRAKRKLLSGFCLLVPIGILIATVPLLYYVIDDELKNKVAWVHTYLGFAVTVPFFYHWLHKIPGAKVPSIRPAMLKRRRKI